MKRVLLTALTLLMSIGMTFAAMSNSRLRKETRFLTDKMAYELNLTTDQYNDVYEINYDFIDEVRYLMDDVMDGYEWALERYYECLDIRNDDLRWVLNAYQYDRFMEATYFYRPIYMTGSKWQFRVYINYPQRSHFYFPKPYHYRTYAGGHSRMYFTEGSYYYGRHYHSSYFQGNIRIGGGGVDIHVGIRTDFAPVKIKPNTAKPAPPKQPKDDIYVTNRKSMASRASVRNSQNSNVSKRQEQSNPPKVQDKPATGGNQQPVTTTPSRTNRSSARNSRSNTSTTPATTNGGRNTTTTTTTSGGSTSAGTQKDNRSSSNRSSGSSRSSSGSTTSSGSKSGTRSSSTSTSKSSNKSRSRSSSTSTRSGSKEKKSTSGSSSSSRSSRSSRSGR